MSSTDINLHFEAVGKGRPLIILHGLLGSADNWRSMSRRLGAHYLIRGGRSNYIEDDDAPLIRQIFPQAEIATLAEAGHWVHVDLPQEFFQTVLNFLNRA
jgi:pimeloyl-ACP methyl ester carboxylesterase